MADTGQGMHVLFHRGWMIYGCIYSRAAMIWVNRISSITTLILIRDINTYYDIYCIIYVLMHFMCTLIACLMIKIG